MSPTNRTKINDRLEIWSEKYFAFTPNNGDSIYKIILVDHGTARMWRIVGFAPYSDKPMDQIKAEATYHAYLKLNRFIEEFERLYA